MEWINAYANLQEQNKTQLQYMSPLQKFSEAHTALLGKFLATTPCIITEGPELASPKLRHPEFHAGNIYVYN